MSQLTLLIFSFSLCQKATKNTMEVPNVLDLLELCENDLDLAIKAVDKLVKKVSNERNENCKTQWLDLL